MIFVVTVMRIMASFAAVGILGLATYWSLRLGYADRLARKDSPEQVKRATVLAPGNAHYRARLAAMLDQSEKDPEVSMEVLEAAVLLNPRDSASWIELGLKAEIEGTFAKAETYFLEAARVDKQYDPRWALANFYFRRNDAENFWPWAREAAAIAYGDPAPLFRLSWRITQDPEVILEQAIPDQQAVLVRYLSFLLDDNHMGALEAVAHKIVRHARHEDLPILFAACNRLLEARKWKAALRIWNGLSARGLIPYQPLEVDQGMSLTNGGFHIPSVLHGFDWRVHAVEGVSVSRLESPPALRIAFSGRQPEICEVLSQFVPLLPGRDYRLRFHYRTTGITADTGLRWRIVDVATGTELAKRSPNLSSENEREEEVLFSTTAETRLGRVILGYQRASGTTRIEGSISLVDVSLAFASP